MSCSYLVFYKKDKFLIWQTGKIKRTCFRTLFCIKCEKYCGYQSSDMDMSFKVKHKQLDMSCSYLVFYKKDKFLTWQTHKIQRTCFRNLFCIKCDKILWLSILRHGHVLVSCSRECRQVYVCYRHELGFGDMSLLMSYL